MGFLSPWFLAGAAALGLPLYLHLLRRDTTTPRPFSSLMFFEHRIQSSLRHRRLRYLMLLALRLALLLLVVLAFADPFINRPAASISANRLLLIVVDNSLSMRAGTRLADAKQAALNALAQRGANEKTQVLAFSSHLQVMSQTTLDRAELRAAIEAIQPTDEHGDYSELARGLHTLTETNAAPIDLRFYSDFQRGAMPGNFADMVFPSNVTLSLHPVVHNAVPNWAVTSITAPGQVWDPKKAAVEAVITGYNTPPAQRLVALVINGQVAATRTVQVPANGSAKVKFDALDVPYGFSRCEVRLQSSTLRDDALPDDDTRRFAVERSDPQPVLFVHDSDDSRSGAYFSSALAAAAESAFVVKQVTTADTADLQASHYAFVVLSDVAALPDSFASVLDRYVHTGGSVLIAVGTNTTRRGRLPILDTVIQPAHNYAAQGMHYLTVGDVDATHPSFAHADKWNGVQFYYAASLLPQGAHVVARLTDQTPLLFDEKLGEGRVEVLASGLENNTNNFPLQPVFVPFIQETALYLGGTQRGRGERMVDTFYDLRTVRSDSIDQSRGIEVVDPDGRRPLSLQAAARAQTIQLTRAGFYQMRLANGRQLLVGVNPDPRESDLSIIPDETLALWRGTPHNPGMAANGAAGSLAEPPKVQFRIWWYVIVAALLAGVAESILASRYLGTLREGP